MNAIERLELWLAGHPEAATHDLREVLEMAKKWEQVVVKNTRAVKERDRYKAALEEIKKLSIADDKWGKEYDPLSPYESYPRADGHWESVDESNGGDIHDHGWQTGAHSASMIAREALKGE